MHKLSTQEFAAVVAALGPRSDRRGSEMRAASRIGVAGQAMVWWMGPNGQAQPAVSVFVQDLSLTGVGLLTSRMAEVGKAFVLGLPRGAQEPLLLCCQVARALELADGVCRVGAQFTRALRPHDGAARRAA